MGVALFVARELLTSTKTNLWAEILARTTAFLAATIALAGFTLASSIISQSRLPIYIGPIVWGFSVMPLFIPRLQKSGGSVMVGSQTWIFISMALTALGGLTIAITILGQLILSHPEII